MKYLLKRGLWLFGGLVLMIIAPPSSRAENPATLDIHVPINATKSLSANLTYYYFGALNLNTSSNSATGIQIRNDSGAFVETYTLQGSNAISDTGGTNWTLAAATGTNTYSLGAQFSSARRNNDQADWESTDYLTTSPQACSATQFGNGTEAESGTNVSPVAGSRDRNLWLKIHTPDISTGTEGRTAQITIAVQ